MDRPLGTLGTHHDHSAVLIGLADHGQKCPICLRDVPRPKSLQHDPAEALRHHLFEQPELNPRKDLDDTDGRILKLRQPKTRTKHAQGPSQFPIAAKMPYRALLIGDVNASVCQGRTVGRIERYESIGGRLCATVPAEKLSREIETHLSHLAFSCDHQGRKYVVSGIAAKHA